MGNCKKVEESRTTEENLLHVRHKSKSSDLSLTAAWSIQPNQQMAPTGTSKWHVHILNPLQICGIAAETLPDQSEQDSAKK